MPRFSLFADDGDGCGDFYRSVDIDAANASIAGGYWTAVDAALHGDIRSLARYTGVVVYDRHGTAYALLTDPEELLRLWYEVRDDSESYACDHDYSGDGICASCGRDVGD